LFLILPIATYLQGITLENNPAPSMANEISNVHMIRSMRVLHYIYAIVIAEAVQGLLFAQIV
jgi:hypothetical protein